MARVGEEMVEDLGSGVRLPRPLVPIRCGDDDGGDDDVVGYRRRRHGRGHKTPRYRECAQPVAAQVRSDSAERVREQAAAEWRGPTHRGRRWRARPWQGGLRAGRALGRSTGSGRPPPELAWVPVSRWSRVVPRTAAPPMPRSPRPCHRALAVCGHVTIPGSGNRRSCGVLQGLRCGRLTLDGDGGRSPMLVILGK